MPTNAIQFAPGCGCVIPNIRTQTYRLVFEARCAHPRTRRLIIDVEAVSQDEALAYVLDTEPRARKMDWISTETLPRPQTRHEHTFQGQALAHTHPGGDQPHGYFGHPEDLPPHEPSDRTGTWRPL